MVPTLDRVSLIYECITAVKVTDAAGKSPGVDLLAQEPLNSGGGGGGGGGGGTIDIHKMNVPLVPNISFITATPCNNIPNGKLDPN